jgi:hypothetical protein
MPGRGREGNHLPAAPPAHPVDFKGWNGGAGDAVHFSRSPYRSPTEPDYSAVHGSAIFSFTATRVERFKAAFPGAIVRAARPNGWDNRASPALSGYWLIVRMYGQRRLHV